MKFQELSSSRGLRRRSNGRLSSGPNTGRGLEFGVILLEGF